MNIIFNKIGSHETKIKLIIHFIICIAFGVFIGLTALFIKISFFNEFIIPLYISIVSLSLSVLAGYFWGRFLLRKIYKVQCNICGWRGRQFHDFTDRGSLNPNTSCPSCLSHRRHRSFFLYLPRIIPKTPLKVLHFAPEVFITKLFKSLNLVSYLSVDIDPAKAMKKEDITKLSFEDSSFDFIFCSHVLEHVEDDKGAMEELYRVLKPNGLAIIDVPIDYKLEKTYECSSIKSPEQRTIAFWQWDHVRLYGKDFPDKLRSVGFEVKIDNFISSLSDKKINYFGLQNTPIYLCKKNKNNH